MVKIEKSLNLKELERYGLVYNDDEGKYMFTTKNKNTITVNVWNRKVEIKQQKTSSHECLEILCNLAKNGFITIEEDRQKNR